MAMTGKLGLSGHVSRFFLDSRLTLLFALASLGLGLFAAMVTPREEEPQISVTLADVLIPFPGASVRDVEQQVVVPAEQLLAQIPRVEHIGAVARPGLAIVSLQFEIGVPRTTALVNLYDTINSHTDAFPANSGVLAPIIKPRDVDDVPTLVLTLYSRNPATTPSDLERVARSMEVELKRVPGTREVVASGGPGHAVMIEFDPARMRASDITVADLGRALRSANQGLPIGDLLVGNQALTLEAGSFFEGAEDIADLVVGVQGGKPVLMRQIATLRDGPPPPSHYIWQGVIPDRGTGQASSQSGETEHGTQVLEYPAVTLTVTKKTGTNVTSLNDALLARLADLRNTVIPREVEVEVSRNLGVSANDNVQLLLEKLVLVTVSVVTLMAFALGRREAAIVFCVILLTISLTLFGTWASGFTLNRASLLALVISIGILVDDAVVVVENIHRHQRLYPGQSLRQIIPGAVDEVGGPTILATFTVIAALMPMATVPGIQGDYFRPIPVIPSISMIMSLLIALTATPWLAMHWMAPSGTRHGNPARPGIATRLAPLFTRFFEPLLHDTRGHHYRLVLALIILVMMSLALALPFFRLMSFNLQPGDNKSNFQVVLDMPPGTPLEQTAAVLHQMAAVVATEPEVTGYQIYAGTAGPVDLTGLLRQYYLRAGGEYGDIQVELVDKHYRDRQSHTIVNLVRPALTRIAQNYGATVKVFDTLGGIPQLSPIVAEVYGPTAEGRYQAAKAIRSGFEKTRGIVDVSDSSIVAAPKKVLLIDRSKAALLGISQGDIVMTLRSGLVGEAVTHLHDGSKVPVPAILQLPADRFGEPDALLQLTVRSASGRLVPLRELVTFSDAQREQPIFHKDLLPVHYVLADVDTTISSPILGMLLIRPNLESIVLPGGGKLHEDFRHPPADPYRGYSFKWDGDWKVSYETFRDLGGAYLVGLLLIYLLIVSQFSSYLTPLIIMAPIPFTIIGINYGHALLQTNFTVSSMIGMMVLAGLLVRNSILLVDFINIRIAAGVAFKEAVVMSANVRSQPIILTSLSAMVAAIFLLDDPTFNGMAVALIFGNLVSTGLTLVVIPTLYYAIYREKFVDLVAPLVQGA